MDVRILRPIFTGFYSHTARETKKKQNLTFIKHNSSLATFTALILLLTVLFTLWGDSMWQEKSITSFNIWLYAPFPQNKFAYLQISVFPTGIEGVKYCLSSWMFLGKDFSVFRNPVWMISKAKPYVAYMIWHFSSWIELEWKSGKNP